MLERGLANCVGGVEAVYPQLIVWALRKDESIFNSGDECSWRESPQLRTPPDLVPNGLLTLVPRGPR